MTKLKEMNDAGWNFDNSYAKLPESLFTVQNPGKVSSPKIILFNKPLAKELGLNETALQEEEGTLIFSGNKIPEGALPLAQAYAGHQFGHFTMLGDGRALLLGEQITPQGKRVDIQLKGSGETPYSRRGDGRAALGPMLREYIISEAMYGLGIPTTRSLSVVTTGESVYRETMQPGAILTRIASSHIRVGTFQYAAAFGTSKVLRTLADYTIQRHFKEVEGNENCYRSLLKEVIKRQALLIAKWQLVGFIHGVMNTDNMTLSGETIDYGPCAFMDKYQLNTVFSSIDSSGRYAYGNQPSMAAWNLARFAETLLPFLDENKENAIAIAQDEVSKFSELYHTEWLSGMRRKLGMFQEEAEDELLVEALLQMMEKYQADYTNTFLALTFDRVEEHSLFHSEEFSKWHELWNSRRNRENVGLDESHQLMKKNNPAVIPRNHRVEEALDAAVARDDYTVFEKLLNAVSNPYAHSREQMEYETPPPATDKRYQTFCGT